MSLSRKEGCSALTDVEGTEVEGYDVPVRIGIDARKLHDFGIGTYIRNLLEQLARLDRQTEFVLICRPEDSETLAALGENFRPVPETAGNYSLSEQVKIPLVLRREGV